MAWSTRTHGDENKEYVVIKHRLGDTNGFINGVKFRAGYGVVEKNTKTYFTLKKLPHVSGQPEYPLTHLLKLKFVTRTSDIKMVYGQDVYYHFLKEYQKVEEKQAEQAKVEEAIAHVVEHKLCSYITKTGTQCKFDALEVSPSKYCRMHISKDPKLAELGIVEVAAKKSQQREVNERIIAKLEKLAK